MKVCIIHDYFNKMGGGERLMLGLARALNADVYTGFIDYNKTFDTSGIKITSLGVSRPGILRNIEIEKRFEKYNFPEYDVYIFSGVWCISAAQHNHPNILYCHTPPRYMYDLKDHFMKKSNVIKRQLLRKMIGKWGPKNQHYMKQFDKICANSMNVKKRIKKFFGNDVHKRCVVVHPGIDTKKFYFEKRGDFFLSTSRIDELKRIGMIIEAFKRTPGRKLVIAGSGPDEKNLRKVAKGYNNIEFVGRVSEKELINLYARCMATIVAARDEDFGMVSVESQAAGKPVIAVNEGGLLENVAAGKTGIFFEPSVESLMDAIEKCEKTKWNHKLIQKNAKKYDIGVFVREMRRICGRAAKSKRFLLQEAGSSV